MNADLRASDPSTHSEYPDGTGGPEIPAVDPGRGIPAGQWSCSGCDWRWNSLRWEHCPACHETFTSTPAGDAHRRDFTCHHPADLRSPKHGTPVLEQRRDGAWQTWSSPEAKAARKACFEKLKKDQS